MTQSPQFSDGGVSLKGDNELIEPLYRTDPRAVAYAVWRRLRDTASAEGTRYVIDNVDGWRWQGHFKRIVEAVYPDCIDNPNAISTFQTTASTKLKKQMRLVRTLETGGGGGVVPATYWIADQWPPTEPTTDHPQKSAPEPEPDQAGAVTAQVSAPAAPDVETREDAPPEVAAPRDDLERALGAYIASRLRDRTEYTRKELTNLRGQLVGLRDQADDAIAHITDIINGLEGAPGGDTA